MANITERLAESVPSRGVTLAYGDTTTIDGKELIPVALVSYGFGGGEGSEGPDAPTGTGGGGGGMSIPVGAYVESEGRVAFQPNLIALIAVSIPFVCTVGWAVAKIVKAAR